MKNKKNNLREHKINSEIRSSTVFLIDQNGTKTGNISIFQAKDLAKEAQMDLVQVAENNSIPVCKIMNYGKYLFELKKNQVKARKENKFNETKEIQVKPMIEENDYQVKLRRAVDFLTLGYKVSFVLKLKGRQNAHPDIGLEVLQKFITNTKDVAKVYNPPKMDGKRGMMLLVPLEKPSKSV